MPDIVIKAENVGKYLIILAVFVIVGLAIFAISFNLGQISERDVISTASPTAQPTIVATPSPYPYVLTFTVLSTTTSNGAYEVFTTTGQHLYCSDYYTWNGMYPRDVYTGTITGQNGAAFIITDIHLMSRYQWTENPDSYWGSHGSSLYDSRSKYDYDYRNRYDRNRVDTDKHLRW